MRIVSLFILLILSILFESSFKLNHYRGLWATLLSEWLVLLTFQR